MKISRRQLIVLYSLLGCGLLTKASAAGNDAPSDIVKSLGLLTPAEDPEFGALITGGAPVATGASRHDEIRQAFAIHLNAPREKDVISTARYYAQLKIKNQDNELYSQEWKVRSNPLITDMFGITATAPAQGDQTQWCAAFVSFVLYLAGKANRYTALSGGYRTFGSDALASPQQGDIAVFSLRGNQGKLGFGHVGFYLRNETKNGVDGVWVLGGNQVGDTHSTGAICEAWFPKEGHELYLHGIRRLPS